MTKEDRPKMKCRFCLGLAAAACLFCAGLTATPPHDVRPVTLYSDQPHNHDEPGKPPAFPRQMAAMTSTAATTSAMPLVSWRTPGWPPPSS